MSRARGAQPISPPGGPYRCRGGNMRIELGTKKSQTVILNKVKDPSSRLKDEILRLRSE